VIETLGQELPNQHRAKHREELDVPEYLDHIVERPLNKQKLKCCSINSFVKTVEKVNTKDENVEMKDM